MSIFAVIKTGGKQYLVEEGDVLAIEKLDANPGDKIEFEVLLKCDGEALEIGAPLVNGKVTAEVLEQGRSKKIEVVKYKAKSRYTRRVGHRQAFTKVKIAKV
jgi:large subunit ribosomal protein L21